ncbi:MAG TPA: hypothetical protein VGO92_15415 [Acidimicrobiales bacterium]|jgi:hypothetical protein|nr:hypothetical protein [Acidimicrobiales bacterium]
MLDHVFVQAIGALRSALDDALLERHALDERFELELMLGDITWETAYTLPGEGPSPRAQAAITFEWSTWSQSAYRSWLIGEGVDEPPEVTVEILFRVQRLAAAPNPADVLKAMPSAPPSLGGHPLEQRPPTIEQQLDEAGGGGRFALEVAYDGSYEVAERVLENDERLAEDMAPLGGWIASTLVRLTDLGLDFLPPDVDIDMP